MKPVRFDICQGTNTYPYSVQITWQGEKGVPQVKGHCFWFKTFRELTSFIEEKEDGQWIKPSQPNR